MEQTHVHTTHEDHGSKNEVRNVTIILSVLTIIELLLGFWIIGMPHGALLYAIKGTIVILMLAKAFYIVGYFMHLKHELRNFIMTIVVPLLLFVWFIIAFLTDGNSFRNLRNTYDPSFKERSTIQAPKHEGHGGATHENKEHKADEHEAPAHTEPHKATE